MHNADYRNSPHILLCRFPYRGIHFFNDGARFNHLRAPSRVDYLCFFKDALPILDLTNLMVGTNNYVNKCSAMVWLLQFEDANDIYKNSLDTECPNDHFPEILPAQRFVKWRSGLLLIYPYI